MAIRRAKQKAQVIEKLRQQAPPGEEFVASVHCETGPSPWLNALFDEIPVVGLVVQLTRKLYYVTLTNTSVVVNTSNRFSNRPGDVVAAWPREQVPLSKVKRGKVWSVMYLPVPATDSPRRLNVHRIWRNEFDQLVAALPEQARAAALDPADDPTAA